MDFSLLVNSSWESCPRIVVQLCWCRGSYINKIAVIFSKQSMCYQYMADLFKYSSNSVLNLLSFHWVLSPQNLFCSEFPEQICWASLFCPLPSLFQQLLGTWGVVFGRGTVTAPLWVCPVNLYPNTNLRLISYQDALLSFGLIGSKQ